jgi:hypothetical protein
VRDVYAKVTAFVYMTKMCLYRPQDNKGCIKTRKRSSPDTDSSHPVPFSWSSVNGC